MYIGYFSLQRDSHRKETEKPQPFVFFLAPHPRAHPIAGKLLPPVRIPNTKVSEQKNAILKQGKKYPKNRKREENKET